MNPYTTPKIGTNELTLSKSCSFPANWIASGCAIIYGILSFSNYIVSQNQTKIITSGIWFFAGFLVFKFPKYCGIVIGILMIGVIYGEYYFIELITPVLENLKEPQYEKTMWKNFWTSIAPFIIGAPFSIVSTWLHRTKQTNINITQD